MFSQESKKYGSGDQNTKNAESGFQLLFSKSSYFVKKYSKTGQKGPVFKRH